jgi:Holliday junction resolvase-like predicted endonuclease
MAENRYQAKLIKKLEKLFPGCVILKNDPSHRQGMLDLTILWKKYWASLEVKDSSSSNMRPNQEYYIERLDKMSFAAKIYPENEREVLDALQQAFKPPRRTRLSES